MTKYYNCDVCEKRFMTQEFLDKHTKSEHPEVGNPAEPKAKGWATPYGFIDMAYPVTFKAACEVAKKHSKIFWEEQND